MARFRVTQNYRSGLGDFTAGQDVELPEDFAAHINRDSPGTLTPATEPEARQVDAPPADRMVKNARRRDRQGDPGDQGAIDRAAFKATKDVS